MPKKNTDFINTLLQEISKHELIVQILISCLAIIAASFFLFRYFNNQAQNQPKPPSLQETDTPSWKNELTDAIATTILPSEYVVKQNDNLWTISEKYYNTGFKWVEIYQANPSINPNLLAIGQKITIPKVEVVKVTETLAPPNNLDSITGTSYTVVKGDNLWSITLRAYRDPYRWIELAKSNSLSYPNFIHPGNILKIPR